MRFRSLRAAGIPERTVAQRTAVSVSTAALDWRSTKPWSAAQSVHPPSRIWSTSAPARAANRRLRHTAAQLDDVVALATKRRWSPTQLLENFVESEHQERTRRSLERRLLRSRVGRFTPMTDFDWACPSGPRSSAIALRCVS